MTACPPLATHPHPPTPRPTPTPHPAVRALAATASEAAAAAGAASGGSPPAGGADSGAPPPPPPQAAAEQATAYADLLRGRYKAHAKHPDVTRALAALDILTAAAAHGSALAPLLEAVAADPADAGARFALAEAQMAVGRHQDAVDACLAVIRAHGPGWRDGAARALLLKIFETLGPAHPVATAGRKALSKLLFR